MNLFLKPLKCLLNLICESKPSWTCALLQVEFYLRRNRTRFLRPVFLVVRLVPWVSRSVTCTLRHWETLSGELSYKYSSVLGTVHSSLDYCRVRVDSAWGDSLSWSCTWIQLGVVQSVSASVWRKFQLHFLWVGGHEGGPILDDIKPRSIFFSVSIDFGRHKIYFPFLTWSLSFPIALLLFSACTFICIFLPLLIGILFCWSEHHKFV